jgi:hypothetical protein
MFSDLTKNQSLAVGFFLNLLTLVPHFVVPSLMTKWSIKCFNYPKLHAECDSYKKLIDEDTKETE